MRRGFSCGMKCSGMTRKCGVLITLQVVKKPEQVGIGIVGYSPWNAALSPCVTSLTFMENVNRREINAALISGLIFEPPVQSVLADKTAVPHL